MNSKIILALFVGFTVQLHSKNSIQQCLALTEEEAMEHCKGLTGAALTECLIECEQSPFRSDTNIE